ncbi:hypothetical protein HZS_3711, partial [Henneguya salminicola]
METWFFKLRKDDIDLFQYICIQKSQACCPLNHYGKKCQHCLGFVNDTMCSGHGKCIGEGTRKGSGECECEGNYNGSMCEKCSDNSYLGEDGLCQSCHQSCADSCVNNTVEGCQGACKIGWTKGPDGICVDVDECSSNTHTCRPDQRCLNVPGRHYCRNCYKSCLTCNGDEANRCLICKPGYVKTQENTCVDVDECLENTHDCKETTYCHNKEGGFECKKCSKACKGGCSGPLLEDCVDCNEGYQKNTQGSGCIGLKINMLLLIDMNECSDSSICEKGKYCLNKLGSYKCKNCDEACRTCRGPGPHSCLLCSSDYSMVKGICKGNGHDPCNSDKTQIKQ